MENVRGKRHPIRISERIKKRQKKRQWLKFVLIFENSSKYHYFEESQWINNRNNIKNAEEKEKFMKAAKKKKQIICKGMADDKRLLHSNSREIALRALRKITLTLEFYTKWICLSRKRTK